MNYLFSPEDEDLAKMKWHKHTGGYAYKWFGKQKKLAHRIVLERKIGRKLRKGELTDHVNRDKIDNRRSNLRIADKSLNTVNRDLRPDNTTGYVGVYKHWPKESQQKGWKPSYLAIISRHGKVLFSGYFKSPELANQARVQQLTKILQ